MFAKLDHVAISVRDMEGAIAFYRDIIGMEKVFDYEFGDKLGRVINEPAVSAHVVHMKLGEMIVELFDYRQPKGREPRPDDRQCDYGLTHIGFWVNDFWGTYRDLVAKGVRLLGEPVELRPNVFVAYFHGAEYEILEIREIVK